MEIWELLIIAFGVSMDAFAVSICKGLSMKEMKYKNAVMAGSFFGGFQALMPLIGYLLGVQFKGYITSIDHWIAFILLAIIGIKMIKESRESCTSADDSFDFKSMTVLAIATSIDALAVGITLAFLEVNIVTSVLIIGITTFAFSFAGVKIGNFFGTKFRSKAELAGGVVLTAMGIKILLSHIIA